MGQKREASARATPRREAGARATPRRTPEAIDADIAVAKDAAALALAHAQTTGRHLGNESPNAQRSKAAWAKAWEAEAAVLALQLERARLNLDHLPPDDDALPARIEAAWDAFRALSDQTKTARSLAWRLGQERENRALRRRDLTENVRKLEDRLADARAQAARV